MTRAPYDNEPLTKREQMAAMIASGLAAGNACMHTSIPRKAVSMADEIIHILKADHIAQAAYDAIPEQPEKSARTLFSSDDFRSLSVRARNKLTDARLVSFEQIVDDYPSLCAQFDRLTASELANWKVDCLARRPTPPLEPESEECDE
jgi:hypothetical protein